MPINSKQYRHHLAKFPSLVEELNKLVPENTAYKKERDSSDGRSGYYSLPPFSDATKPITDKAFRESLVECFYALDAVFYKLADEVVELVSSNTDEKNKSEIQLKTTKMQALREIYCELLMYLTKLNNAECPNENLEKASKTFSEVLLKALRDEDVMKGFDSSTKKVITMVSNLPIKGTLEVRINELNQKIADYGNKTGAGFAFSGREFKDKKVKKSAAEKLKLYATFEVTQSGRKPDKLTENELKAAQEGTLGEIYKKFPQELRTKIEGDAKPAETLEPKPSA